MIELAQTYSKEIAAVVAVFFGFLLNRYLRTRARLVHSVRHAFTFLLDEVPVADGAGGPPHRPVVHTASISVTNLGREVAEDVEIVFNWRPQFINVWPSRYYGERIAPDKRYSITLEGLAPGEVFGVEILSINGPLPAVNTVRSQNSTSSQVPMMPQQVFPRWINLLAGALMTLGAIAFVYIVIVGIQFLSSL
jgi:hypothetical protein